MIRGVGLVDRYGPEIEYDFLALLHGVDLSDWFSGRGAPAWGKLVRLTDQLPTHSRFKAAMLDDDEFAAEVGVSSDDDSDKPSRLTLADYDPLVAKMTDMCDLLIILRDTLVTVNSEKGKGPKGTKYMPRPQTAFDRLRARKRQEKMSDLRSRLVPGEVSQ